MTKVVNNFAKSRYAVLFVLILLSAAQADTLRVVTYNILNFRGAPDNGRIPHYRTVLRALAPDVVVFQEIHTSSAVDSLRRAVLQPINSDWQSAPFMDGPDTDNALLYRTSKVRFISQRAIHLDVRDVQDYLIQPLASDSTDPSQRIHIFSAHLKAGQDDSDANQRADECTMLRTEYNLLPANTMFMMVGDFNIYTSDEVAYQNLISIGSNNNGRLFDPINMPGDWNNNSSFAPIHTQSPRTSSFGGGATGGLDDRFDFILVSAALNDNVGSCVIPSTYKSFGNDGQHFNQAINDGVNHAVPDSVADALHAAADHLPVVANFYIEPTTNAVQESGAIAQNYLLMDCYPNPFNSILMVDIQSKNLARSLEIFDLTGRKVMEHNIMSPLISTQMRLNFDGQSTGTYLIRLNTQTESIIRKVQLIR